MHRTQKLNAVVGMREQINLHSEKVEMAGIETRKWPKFKNYPLKGQKTKNINQAIAIGTVPISGRPCEDQLFQSMLAAIPVTGRLQNIKNESIAYPLNGNKVTD